MDQPLGRRAAAIATFLPIAMVIFVAGWLVTDVLGGDPAVYATWAIATAVGVIIGLPIALWISRR